MGGRPESLKQEVSPGGREPTAKGEQPGNRPFRFASAEEP